MKMSPNRCYLRRLTTVILLLAHNGHLVPYNKIRPKIRISKLNPKWPVRPRGSDDRLRNRAQAYAVTQLAGSI